MKFEYNFFLLHAVPYLAEPRRAAMLEWLKGIGAEGWEVFMIAPQRDNEAGLVAWAKRPIKPEGMGDRHPLGQFMPGAGI